MALKYSGKKIILRAVLLRDLPAEVLAVSPQATVPVLVFNDNEFMTESWDIVKWALQQHDPDNWLGDNNQYQLQAERLVEQNDASFKQDLDRYKYADRYPEQPMEYYRSRCEAYIAQLDGMLEAQGFLLADRPSIADLAVFPFIRQFSMVDKAWFDQSPYPAVQRWLGLMLATEWFIEAFKQQAAWRVGAENVYL